MKPRSKKGSVLTTLIIALVILAAALGLVGFILTKLDLLPKIGSDGTSSDDGEKFTDQTVLRSASFKNSKGENKKFIVVKINEEGGIPIADAYITDSKLSKNKAIKITQLGQDSSLGYAASVVRVGNTGLLISISPEKGKKYIVLSQTIEEATTITIIDEEGQMISDKVVANVLNVVEDKCKCSFVFDSWNDHKFSLKIRTSSGEILQALIDAENGQVIDGIKKV